MDFASLGIKVTSNGVKEGAAGLDDLTRAATSAEHAAERVTPAVAQIGTATRGAVSGAQNAATALREAAKEVTGFESSARQAFDSHVEQFQRLQRIKSADALPGGSNFVGPIKEQTAALNAAGLSAGQYRQAMRLLPAQITDVVTSLASGSPAYLVAIQQGGQLRDSFGGFGATLKALGTIITPARLAIGGLAGGAAILLKAFLDGQGEGEDYAKAIALSGNAANTSGSQLQGYAADLDRVIGTQHNAAAVLAQLAGSGLVANAQLRDAAEAAIRLQKSAGVAVVDTVKQFAALGEKPTEAVAKLNRQYHFLSAATYEQIKALEKEGDTTGAAALAQKAYGDAMTARAKQIDVSLGSLQRAARSTGNFFKEMWDAVLDIGREDTTEEKLSAVRKRLEKFRETPDAPAGRGGGAGLQKQRLQDQAKDLEQQIAFDRLVALRADTARKTRDNAIADSDRKDADREKDQRATDALRKARLTASLADIQRGLQAETDVYDNQGQLLEARRAANLVGDKTYYAEKIRLIEQNTAAQVKALQAENAKLASQKVLSVDDRLKTEKTITPEARTRAEKAVAVDLLQIQEHVKANDAEILSLTGKQITETQSLRIAQDAAADSKLKAYRDEIAAGNEYIQTLEKQYAREVQAAGQGRRQQQFDAGLAAIEDKQAERRRQLERDRDNATNPDTKATLSAKLRASEEVNKQEVALYRAHFDEMSEVQANWVNGASSALRDYVDASKDVASQSQEAFGNAFHNMEDALVRFAQTGKLNFKDLANSIIGDLVRIQLKAQLSKLFELAGTALGFGDLSDVKVTAQKLGTRASGGPVDANTPYLVGEKGPELIVPRHNGTVIPNNAMGGGGGVVQNLNFYPAPNTDVATMAAMVERAGEQYRAIAADDAFRARGGWRRVGT